jgi:hypothetical protein
MTAWEVAYQLDGWGESYTARADTAGEAVWKAALDLADRGFGDRVQFVAVYERATASLPKRQQS